MKRFWFFSIIFIFSVAVSFAGIKTTTSGDVTIHEVTRYLVADYTINTATLVVGASDYVAIQVLRSASGTVAVQGFGLLPDLTIQAEASIDPKAPLVPIPVFRTRDQNPVDKIEEAGIYYLEIRGSHIPIHNIRLTFRFSPQTPNNHPYKVFVRKQ
jgi:hypothetical protein